MHVFLRCMHVCKKYGLFSACLELQVLTFCLFLLSSLVFLFNATLFLFLSLPEFVTVGEPVFCFMGGGGGGCR